MIQHETVHRKQQTCLSSKGDEFWRAVCVFNLQLDLHIGEPMQICIHQKDNSPKPVNHRLTLKEGPKIKSNIRKFLAQDFI